MKYVIISSSSGFTDGPTMFLHKEGCRDIGINFRKHYANYWDIEGSDPEDAIANQLIDFWECEQGYGREDFSIAPCLKDTKLAQVMQKQLAEVKLSQARERIDNENSED